MHVQPADARLSGVREAHRAQHARAQGEQEHGPVVVVGGVHAEQAKLPIRPVDVQACRRAGVQACRRRQRIGRIALAPLSVGMGGWVGVVDLGGL